MSTLAGRHPKDTYRNLLQIDNSNLGVDATLRTVQDGAGNPTALALSTGGASLTGPGTFAAYANNVAQLTLTSSDRPTTLGLFEGTSASPSTSGQRPLLWVQKYLKIDTGGATNHQVGGGFVNVEIQGSGNGASPNRGTWHGLTVSVDSVGTNTGTSGAPSYDTDGDVVGIAGFARNNAVPGNGRIVTALWAYPEGPSVDPTTYGNLPANNWSICGLEVNIANRAVDPGVQTVLVGKGSSVGVLLQNYRDTGAGVFDWTFGMALGGTPNDGNSSGLDFSLWSGFHTGLLVDKCRDYGILFGKYWDAASYCVAFPTSYSGYATRPLAALRIGDNAINLATAYSAASIANGDFYTDGSFLKYKIGGVACRMLMSNANVVTLPGSTTWSINGGFNFVMSTVVNAVNYVTCFNAVTGNDPALATTGETTAGLELRGGSAGSVYMTVNSVVKMKANSTGLGFFAATPVAKPTVTGSRGANAALASLLTGLANLGLVTDSSS